MEANPPYITGSLLNAISSQDHQNKDALTQASVVRF